MTLFAIKSAIGRWWCADNVLRTDAQLEACDIAPIKLLVGETSVALESSELTFEHEIWEISLAKRSN